MPEIRVAIVDDHPLVIEGIMVLLQDMADITLCGAAQNGIELFKLLDHSPADVLLMDISLKRETGVELLPQLRSKYPALKTIALTMHNEQSLIKQMLKNGAVGYVLKDINKDELMTAIRTVASGDTYFSAAVQETIMTSMVTSRTQASSKILPQVSRREKEILKLIVEEQTTAEIAKALFISIGTVETHRRNLLNKLGARNTAGLVRICIENDLLKK